MRDKGDHYEYVAVYVDEHLIASSKNPQEIINWLEKKNLFKLKGTGPISFHLGCDFFCDKNNTLCIGPKSYIECMAMQYELMFGKKPKAIYTSNLSGNDYLEIDTTPFLNDNGILQYQSLFGVFQWTITLGQFDICTAPS